MRLRTVLVPLGATLASALVPGAAHAAVPKTKPQQTLMCDTFGNTAKLWYTKKKNVVTRLAVDASSCSGWVGAVAADGHDGYTLIALAPHASFNRHVHLPSPADYRPFLRAINDPVFEMCPGPADLTQAYVVWPHNHGRLEAPSSARWCRNQ
jgi:hypothetical protein